VAQQCDTDAFGFSGQKCSAQSICFVHENWSSQGFEDDIRALASQRSIASETINPVLSVNNETFEAHVNAMLEMPGVRVAFGGKVIPRGPDTHSFAPRYGCWEPTAISVPLSTLLDPKYYGLCITEIFGPYTVLVEYKDNEIDGVLEALERMTEHLTAAIVSNDPHFQQKILGSSVNGTTYVGSRARTTGAPQNHWFGPCGDPRGAGIGTPEAIQLVWSGHREVVMDVGPLPADWTEPPRN
jgi:1-pyrroline-5-carboxylate dehydrogenase